MKKIQPFFGFLLVCLMGIYGCTQPAPLQSPPIIQLPSPPYGFVDPYGSRVQTNFKIEDKPLKIALFLPLSGAQRSLGQALLQAATLSLFEGAEKSSVVLVIRDTKGTRKGAREAFLSAQKERINGILGPVFSPEVQEIKLLAQQYRLSAITFSTDHSAVGAGVYTLGFLPLPQVRRVLKEAHRQGITDIVALLPQQTYGDLLDQELSVLREKEHISVRTIGRYRPQALTSEETTHQELEPALKALKKGSYSAIFIPEGGTSLEKIAFFLSKEGISPQQTYYLGTGQWDAPKTLQDPLLENAWFAAPNPEGRQNFEQRFRQIYGMVPPRLSTLAYDGVALVKVLDQVPGGFSDKNIKFSKGFQGIDGVFRFLPSGLVERGLCVFAIQKNNLEEISPAPQAFLEEEKTQM